MSSSKKDIKDVKIYRDLLKTNNGLNSVDIKSILLPFKGSDKPTEEMIANEIPKWVEPGDPLYEFMKEQIEKKYGNSGVIFCPYVNVSVKDPKKRKINEIYRFI